MPQACALGGGFSSGHRWGILGGHRGPSDLQIMFTGLLLLPLTWKRDGIWDSMMKLFTGLTDLCWRNLLWKGFIQLLSRNT